MLLLHLQVVHKVPHHLQELHALGFVHNDVAIPSVVVHVTDDYQLLDAHLVEFTVACLSEQPLAMKLDPRALPCVASEGASTPATDIFSLSMLLRELSQFNGGPEELLPQAPETVHLATLEEQQVRPNYTALETLLGVAVTCQESDRSGSRPGHDEGLAAGQRVSVKDIYRCN